MSEFEPLSTDIFSLDFEQVYLVAKTVKSSQDKVTAANERMADSHPFLFATIREQIRINAESPEFYTPRLLLHYDLGACMAYTTLECIAESYNFTFPSGPNTPFISEWVIDKNRVIENLSNTDLSDFEPSRGVELLTCLPEFRQQAPQYLECAMRSIARIKQMPLSTVHKVAEGDMTRYLVDVALANKRDERLVIGTQPLDQALEFLNGYGRVILAMKHLSETEALNDY